MLLSCYEKEKEKEKSFRVVRWVQINNSAEGTEFALALPDLWLPCPQGGHRAPSEAGSYLVYQLVFYMANDSHFSSSLVYGKL